ncbi:MAG: PIG-L deacetylase family protein [Sulfuricaulis sp.]|nr:PIG-L deacetylase family protein [Sulfuricaulis sp.]
MFRFTLNQGKQPLRTVLCLGAHCDDIEIGCGGTVLKLIQQCPDLQFHWVIFSSDPQRAREAQESAALFLAGAGSHQVIVKDFKNSFFPYVGEQIKNYFEELRRTVQPDLILTHYRHDLHQDHRVIAELTWNSFRDHLILEYEIPKYDGDLGTPNCYVELDEVTCSRKVEVIMRSFASQRDKQWFTEDTFLAILRLRGIEANSAGRYAEAFYCRKLVI